MKVDTQNIPSFYYDMYIANLQIATDIISSGSPLKFVKRRNPFQNYKMGGICPKASK